MQLNSVPHTYYGAGTSLASDVWEYWIQ